MPRDYSKLYDSEHEVEMLQDADNAITQCGLWDWLKEFNPNERGFMCSSNENLDVIYSKMKLYDLHSGSSLGWTMRQMEYVAKNGFQDYTYRRKAHIKYMRSYDYKMLEIIIDQATTVEEVERITKLIEDNIETVYKDLKDETIESRFPYTCKCHKERALRGWCGVAGGGVPGCEH